MCTASLTLTGRMHGSCFRCGGSILSSSQILPHLFLRGGFTGSSLFLNVSLPLVLRADSECVRVDIFWVGVGSLFSFSQYFPPLSVRGAIAWFWLLLISLPLERADLGCAAWAIFWVGGFGILKKQTNKKRCLLIHHYLPSKWIPIKVLYYMLS